MSVVLEGVSREGVSRPRTFPAAVSLAQRLAAALFMMISMALVAPLM